MKKRGCFIVIFLFLSIYMYAQADPQLNIPFRPSAQKTFCNPMDINYQYNWEQVNQGISYRSGADPVIINHKGEYFLFHTIQGGYWWSKDLLDWRYVRPSRWPMEDMCAPAAYSKGDTLFLFQSTFQQRPIFYTTNPKFGKLSFYNRWLPQLPPEIGPWDPALFYDEELKRWFMYWGSSNTYPIFGAELDPSKKLSYKSAYQGFIHLDPLNHGWERFGQDHSSDIKPFTEGAWMTKSRNQYFLQYGAPGTEYNVYANGTYVADSPLGPFKYAPYNPISYKPGGFMQGLGHGCTFQDNYGNYWNMGTPWIAVNWNFERRIAMVPAGFNAENEMYANSRFADFPHFLPKKKWKKSEELFTGWMLLSYKKPAFASSQKDSSHTAALLTDENPRTFWVAQENNAKQYAYLDLEQLSDIRAVQINYTDYKSNIYDSADPNVYTQFSILVSNDAKTWRKVYDNLNEKRDRPNAYIELKTPAKARYVKFQNEHVAGPNLALSDIRVFGKAGTKVPETCAAFMAIRDKDTRNAQVYWEKVPGAVGYNMGFSP
jgi:xylan 1,4-beta-xylosidase